MSVLEQKVIAQEISFSKRQEGKIDKMSSNRNGVNDIMSSNRNDVNDISSNRKKRNILQEIDLKTFDDDLDSKVSPNSMT